MSKIDTLIGDIHETLRNGYPSEPARFPDDIDKDFSTTTTEAIRKAVRPETKVRPKDTLYMSEIGKPCVRQLWYSINEPSKAEELPTKTSVKFLTGDLLESAVLALSEYAGHTVDFRQHKVSFSVDGVSVTGRIDCTIDGVLVDVKTASKYSFAKFIEGLTDRNDSFGYRHQLHGYNFGLYGDSPSRQGFLVVEKTLGDIEYVDLPHSIDIVEHVSTIVGHLNSSTPPKRGFNDVPEGTSGNRTLGTECSYCAFKHACWPGLRTFLYSSGPKYLTTVKKLPKVYEITL